MNGTDLDDANAYRASTCIVTNTSEFTTNGTALLFTNNVDGVFYFEGASGDVFEELTLSSDFTSLGTVAEIEEFWNHLFTLYYNDNGITYGRNATYHSVDIPEVTYANKDLTEHVLTDSRGSIMRAVKLGYEMIVFSSDSISICKRVGGLTLFSIPTLVYNTGLLSRRAVEAIDNRHFFVGSTRKLYQYQGGTAIQSFGDKIDEAMRRIEQAGKGAIICLRQEGRGIGLTAKLHAYHLQETGMDTVQANEWLGYKADKRDYGIGAQICRDLGLQRIANITNNPIKTNRLQVYGITVVEQVALEVRAHEHNRRYLQTKRDKMGHILKKL